MATGLLTPTPLWDWRRRYQAIFLQTAPAPRRSVSAPGAFSVLEQNFDFDLLTPQKMLEKYVGQTVNVVRTNPATGVETRDSARILANNGGTVVQIGDRIEILGQYGARVIFPSLPPNLRARPTLSITLESAAAGPRRSRV